MLWFSNFIRCAKCTFWRSTATESYWHSLRRDSRASDAGDQGQTVKNTALESANSGRAVG